MHKSSIIPSPHLIFSIFLFTSSKTYFETQISCDGVNRVTEKKASKMK